MIIISTFLYKDGKSDPEPQVVLLTEEKVLLLISLATQGPAGLLASHPEVSTPSRAPNCN